MKKWLRIALVLGTALGSLLLLLAHYGRMVSPASNAWIPLLVMGYPILLLFFLMCTGLWLVIRRKVALWLILLLLLFAFSSFQSVIQFSFPSESKGTYTLSSYNTRLFGFYQFDRNESIRDSIMVMLEELDSDILCFQEYYYRDAPEGFKTTSILQERIGPLESHEKFTHEFVHKQYFGVVTMSKFPIVSRGYIPFDGDINNFCIYSDIALPNQDTIRVFNAHLASIHFTAEDYSIVDNSLQDMDENLGLALGIIEKIQMANTRRVQQVKHILDAITQSPYPVVFAGDFNAPPFSHTYFLCQQVLEDAFVEKGSGMPGTYIGPFPSFRIDHIFHDENVMVRDYSIIESNLSDHKPVSISFDLKHE